ncbi:unnamed protein product [Bursaphelenchus okinawaensis]|uniref:Dynein light chain n=1 Tax=Bursaphelenchus okinawaensis TaxID=465554 RepID=A0A811L0X6_9BILA|nr:unnamed protein product [Bursaphelenchus okinawaensis]CAG9115690.1 unnamed protein product [Bursaphelenchus okinawaensis]
MYQRKRFSVRRNGTRRWKYAREGEEEKPLKENMPMSVRIESTTFNEDKQKQAVEIANHALDICCSESEIASFIKTRFDDITDRCHHVIVGRNFGSHISAEEYIKFRATKIIILIYQCGSLD